MTFMPSQNLLGFAVLNPTYLTTWLNPVATAGIDGLDPQGPVQGRIQGDGGDHGRTSWGDELRIKNYESRIHGWRMIEYADVNS